MGIIGGADGPTAIFVTTSIGEPLAYCLVGLLVLAVVLLWRRRTRKKQ